MTFKIQSMDAFDDVFKDAEPPPEEPAEPDKPARSYSAENPPVPPWVENPVKLADVQPILAVLGHDLARFRVADYPEIVIEYSERYRLHEAWDWTCALKASSEPKLAALAVLQVRYEKGLFNGVPRT